MHLYFITFAVAIGFAFCSDLCQRQIAVAKRELAGHDLWNAVTAAKIGKNVFLLCSAAVLILLSGLRYDTGVDYYYSYVPSLETVRAGSASHYDPLFNFIIACFARLQDNQWFFAAMALYTVGMIYFGICRRSEYISIPVALYLVSFNYLRSFCFVAQYVALATFSVGFTALLKKKWIPAAILIVLAVLLHQSAIIVVPFLLMYFMRTRWMMVVSILLPVFALLGQGAVRVIFVMFGSGTRFDYYFGSEYDMGYVDNTLILINFAVFAMFLFVYYMTQAYREHDRNLSFYMLAQSFALSFSLLQSVIPLGYRFVWFFMFLQCLSIPLFLKRMFSGAEYYVMNLVIIVLFLAWMIMYPLQGTSNVLPYHPIFDPMSSY